MKKIIVLIIIFLSIFKINNIFADFNNINSELENAYNSFIIKVEKKYPLEKVIGLLKQIDEILKKASNNSKYSEKKLVLINDLKYLNFEKLKKIQIKLVYLEKAKQKLLEKQLIINNENIFQKEYSNNSNKNILDEYHIVNNFSHISYDKDKIFIENGIWYYYDFINYKFFETPEKLKISDLENNGISIKTSLIFLTSENNIGFITDFDKIKLINDNIIYGIPNKIQFLREIKDDKEFLIGDTDILFEKLKEETKNITNGLNIEEKIKIIYHNILNNYEYSKKINLSDYKIFSGIELYSNGEGICEAYVKLFMYMLNFAGIDNTEIIRGYVIDAEDFPEIGHAWVRVGDKYYDPTFDDPVGLENTRQFNEYKYFGLPKDLFYTNKYDYEDLPEFLKTKELNYRRLLIQKNLYEISSKYEGINYVLLHKTNFKKEHNINYNEILNLETLNKIKEIYDVKNFTFRENGKEKFIKKLNYYIINNDNINSLLEQLEYNLYGYYFFKWYESDGNYNYRIGYNLEF